LRRGLDLSEHKAFSGLACRESHQICTRKAHPRSPRVAAHRPWKQAVAPVCQVHLSDGLPNAPTRCGALARDSLDLISRELGLLQRPKDFPYNGGPTVVAEYADDGIGQGCVKVSHCPANASAGAWLAADLIHDDSWRHSPGRCSASLKIATHYALPVLAILRRIPDASKPIAEALPTSGTYGAGGFQFGCATWASAIMPSISFTTSG